ncbi:MAG: SpaH/EbpB family LPXTG-anchored major pilin [Tessaracoccus sp.]|uniref:SpaH/EbpB family LPXTG-anchored major pilin n=1 Tax=Tessaracoccus sp. TaxID=1971211 RepID=UPI001EC1FF56|nr:SpaH/EbpB family LPXTG-anchored major pilin [Tessaracoccus sp.]MBK7821977.1 SpaH/EbpB family LPXTG-anchored major pilin [Tessaracoccus sp.]
MIERNTLSQRLTASVGAFALVAMGLLGTDVANADLGAAGTPPGNAAPGTTGQLTVHKRAGAHDGTSRDDGTVNADPGGTALAGVEFTLQRVGLFTGGTCVAINLATTEGWDAAATALGTPPSPPAVTPAEGDLCADGAATVQTTAGTAGSTTFAELALGLYYVTETDAPEDVVERALPFYVTVPFPTGTNLASPTQWLYDIHVYPKNSVAAKPVKTITEEPDAFVVSSDVTWIIDQVIPTLPAPGSEFSSAVLTDVLDGRLSYVSSTVQVVDPALPDGGGSPTVLDTLTTAAVDDPAGTLTWALNATDLTTLRQHMGKTIRITLVTTVDEVGNGTIPNTAVTSSFNGRTPQASESAPRTYWGNLEITAVDKDSDVGLIGAEFALWAATGGTCSLTAPGTPAVATGTSDANGVVQWLGVTPTSPLGLWIANSDTAMASPNKAYCVYQTKAPAGYVPITAGTLTTVTSNGGTALEIDIDNTKRPGPDLPLTGGTGTAIFGGVGLALIVVAVAVGLSTRRKRAAK